MVHLLPLMLERVGILLIIAFVLSRMKSFRQIIQNEHGIAEKLMLIVVFGAFGIVSNYTAVQIHDNLISTQAWSAGVDSGSALANTRIMGVAIGGLLGGPLVGTGVGLLAGIHRLTLGGYTAFACGISTILAGMFTGLIGKRFRIQNRYAAWHAALIGILMEGAQMGIILLAAEPWSHALELVKMISVPMIVVNGFGTLLFMLIIQSIFQEEERTRALQTHQALYIADQTLPYFRQGLNAHSCREAALIILKETNADAISITNEHQILAHVGAGSDHHVPLQPISTQLTHTVLKEGRIHTARAREEIHCLNPDCVLQAALVLPLKAHHRTVGTLKLYFARSTQLDQVEQELGEGLSKLFSTQLELAEAELQSKLLRDAEIKALQAQIHPHFLFNAFNTISVLCRTDPEKARDLLQQLSIFFRSNLQGARTMLIPLHKELEHVEAYLSLEQARFPDKYTVSTDIDPELEDVLVPPFTLQPLVENAVRHAFPRGAAPPCGSVTLQAYREGDRMILLTRDNGQGISKDIQGALGNQAVDSAEGTGTALYNIRQRMAEIYGKQASFRIDSEPGHGTTVMIAVPIQFHEWREASC
ncbi:sensor histidine kinase [Paenibacillus dendritiformis]|uniref:histidine kinase n=1 Tax=Paenibacillus dendritiformis C454 TaxID=1131935 RepID=H3SKV8_9BACL|nr:sensor histidine kinase [Paenibacillus dendritiformis]EHQ60303.1 signal transduction histidine kinase LytS [Paenibacillus dendritiformis C454]PZM65659.1 sensor histidine kinase [Paenibacillus dendritiformis]WGU93199.1 sensor histidine kinase [Paenibacillus dendritiformis]CAH8767995.1 sensor histidine kinase [Paenibacillus dendritiformis]